jgi:catechol 2,3-dioxygenase-like lactoylglutathione lyase family enzyme
MKIEHIATNVADPVAVAAWYCEHLGMRIVRHKPEPAEMHFLTDEAGSMWEIYRNPPDNIPNYAAMDSLQLHLAFVSEDPAVDSDRLIAAGASKESEANLPDGSQLVMLRDPWGLALQLCKRGTPFEE